MNLIYYRGLNCHLACVINIAAYLGVNYQDAFGTLWSETDFDYDPKYHIYLSKRVFYNLEALGAKLEVLNCASNEESEESFSLITEGEFFVVGMDTFHIPWSAVYQNFYEPHYFFAQKKPDSVLCFDPTYNQNNLQLMHKDIVPNAFDLIRIHKLVVNPPRFDISQEASEILHKHSETKEKLSIEIHKFKNKDWKNTISLIKLITAMINNRYLFQRFLRQYTLAYGHNRIYFDKDFFLKWEAVKNGLHKASIIKNNERVVNEVYNLFLNLLREETDMAKEIIMSEADFVRCKN